MPDLSTTLTPPAIQTTPLHKIAYCASDRKLYLPYGSMRLPEQQARVAPSWMSLVTVHWFVVGRSEPIVPYLTVIQGYRTLTAAARTRAELMVDEFFREDEYHQLRAYLQERHHKDLRTSMLTTPVTSIKPDGDTRIGRRRPFAQPAPESRDTVAIHKLSEESGYSLPFTVWGVYIETNPSPDFRRERITNSVENLLDKGVMIKEMVETGAI